jgi:hypothetical protein
VRHHEELDNGIRANMPEFPFNITLSGQKDLLINGSAAAEKRVQLRTVGQPGRM